MSVTENETEPNLGKCKLVSITTPMIDGLNTAEDLIVYCARVSNPNNQFNTDTGAKLLKYCIDHGHWSIFEQADMTVEIVTSVAIAAQILRHKSASFQQYSARYSKVQKLETIVLRKQAEKNRQSSEEVFNPLIGLSDDNGEYYESSADKAISDHMDKSHKLYKELIDSGVAKECARFVLPQCASTTMYMKNNIRNWIHYIQLRTKEDTQLEHREIAEEIKSIFKQQFPIISECLGW